MSSTQTRTLEINRNNYTQYVSNKDRGVTMPSKQSGYMARLDTSSSAGINIYLETSATKDTLFPNETAHPTKMNFYAQFCRTGLFSGTAHLRFRLGGTDVGIDWTNTSKGYDTTGDKDISSNVVTSMTRGTSITINGYATAEELDLRRVILTTYFTRYDFSAVGMSGVTTSVSSATGFDGDSITWTANVQNGFTFNGWYSDAARTQLVSQSTSYTETVNGSDRTLYAKVTSLKTVSISYNGTVISVHQHSGDVSVLYDGTNIATISTGTKILNCAGKVAKSNIVIGNETLNCAGKVMKANVTISVS